MLLTNLKNTYYQKKFELDLYLSKLFYKNLTGFDLNKQGLKRWESNKKIFREKVGSTLNKYNGFPLGYDLFKIEDNDLLKRIITRYNQIINSSEHAMIYDENNKITSPEKGKFFLLKDILSSIPEVIELLNQQVQEKLYHYYGCHFLVTHISAYRTTNLPNAQGSSEVYAHKLHYDRHPSDTLKLFVNLSDVTLEDGPFNFFDRVNSKKVLKAGYKDRTNYGKAIDIIEDPEQKIFFTGKSGAAAIVDTTSCLHKAGIPKADHIRDLLIFNFESTSLPLDMTTQAKLIDIQK